MKNILAERLKELRASSGLSQEKVAQGVGVTHGYYHQLENGKMTNPSFDLVFKIAAFFNISLDELMSPRKHEKNEKYLFRGVLPVPVFSNHIPPEDVEEPDEVEKYLYSPLPDQQFGFKVADNSMAPCLETGDILVCAITEKVEDGDLALVKIKAKDYIVRKVQVADGHMVLLSENNEKYPAIVAKKFEIIGKGNCIVKYLSGASSK